MKNLVKNFFDLFLIKNFSVSILLICLILSFAACGDSVSVNNDVVVGGIDAQTPGISDQPHGGAYSPGSTVTLKVRALTTDGGTLTYQWYSNTENSNSGGTEISGATGDTYMPNTATLGITYYYVVVTNTIPDNGDGGVKTASIASDPAKVEINNLVNAQIPDITVQPQGGTYVIDSPVTLNVTAAITDGGTLTYQWYSNTTNSNSGGTEISGATNASYMPSTATIGTTYYYVVVTNTIFNNGDGGEKIALIASDAATVMTSLIDVVQIPGGSFGMGPDYLGTIVTCGVTAFKMSKYLVTQEQYEYVMGANPSNFTITKGKPPATGEVQGKRPVETVSWYHAIVFCNRLSILEGLTPVYEIFGSTDPDDWGAVPTGNNAVWNAVIANWDANGYRLPTEAQWEYACRAGTTGLYSFGDDETILGDYAWYYDNSNDKTHEVGKKLPNPWVLYDMYGNVEELCWDWYDFYPAGPVTDYDGPSAGSARVIRGGSLFLPAELLRSSVRSSINPGYGYGDVGFRVVRP